MTLMTRAVTAFAVLTTAAIPVGALTVKNTSSNEVSIAVDSGASEGVYQIPAGGSVSPKEDCSSDCAVTGPWGFSRLVAQNATIETDGTSLVTAGAAPSASDKAAAPSAAPQSLVPQNPVEEAPASAETTTSPAATKATAAAPAETAPAAAPQKPRRASKPRKQAQPAQKGPGSGSFEMLFQGPGKK